MADLTGKVALITGGAQRIGRATALALANGGADVAITYLNSEKEGEQLCAEIEKLGRRGMAVRCDVRNASSVQKTVARVVKELGGLDVLVNNAGRFENVAFDQLTIEQWDAMFETNARGPFLVTKAARDTLRAHQGRVINIASLGGIRPWATHAHYCASKAALIMLTQAMAKALAPDVTVNCVAPGMIETGQAAEELQRFAKKTPMGRNGVLEDVAQAVLFFATAPRFITGQVLVVDGGLGLS
jgi:3-oxoacyl-[acyl-carrier protein] reductase/pteridine reductase